MNSTHLRDGLSERVLATFDIGGTNMRSAVVACSSKGWRFVDRFRRPTPNYLLNPTTPAAKRLQDLLQFVTDYARNAAESFGAEGVTVAFPGPIDAEGRVLALPTLWGPSGQSLCPIPIAELLHDRLPALEIKVMNDVTAAGYRFVSGGPDFAIFTLGSGLGLKVFINGRPQVGPHGRGGELGHMVFDDSSAAPLCDCGGRGHLGALVSGRAWQRLTNSGVRPDAQLHEFVRPLTRAVAMLHFSLGLERFILAGGLVDGLGESLREVIVNDLPRQGWDIGQDWDAMLHFAPADDSHALIGGALACMCRGIPSSGTHPAY